MEQPTNISPSQPAGTTGRECGAEPVVILPPQFSLAEVLLVTAEVALCCALWQIDLLARAAPVLLGGVFLMIHVSRGRVALGVLFGSVVGLLLMLAAVFLIDLGLRSYVWASVGSFVVPICALYGGAVTAITTEPKLYGLTTLALLLPFLSLAGLCLLFG